MVDNAAVKGCLVAGSSSGLEAGHSLIECLKTLAGYSGESSLRYTQENWAPESSMLWYSSKALGSDSLQSFS